MSKVVRGVVACKRYVNFCTLGDLTDFLSTILTMKPVQLSSKRYDVKECVTSGVYCVNLRFKGRNLINESLYT